MQYRVIIYQDKYLRALWSIVKKQMLVALD